MAKSLRGIDKRISAIVVVMFTLASIACTAGSPVASPTSPASKTSTPAASSQQTAPPAKAKSGVDQILDAANKEGKVVLYESSAETDIAKVAAAFNKRYPGIKVEQVRLAGADQATRVQVETQAGGPTADVIVQGADTAYEFAKQGLLQTASWTDLGVDSKLVADPTAVFTLASLWVVAYNTKSVSDSEAPKTWENLLDPKWKGKIVVWVQPNYLSEFVPTWGEEKTTDFVKKLKAQQPIFKASSAAVAETISSGEAAIGIPVWHTVQPLMEKGAPIKGNFLEPTPINSLFSMMPTKGAHPNAARVFIAWLHSPEGGLAYEQAIARGNPLIPGTQTASLMAGKTISDFQFSQGAEIVNWNKKFADIMK